MMDVESGNPFVSLGELLQRKVSVATLATAIEKDGIYTWDKFGRFGKASKEDEARALKCLAGWHEWDQDREPHTGEHIHMDRVDLTVGDGTPFESAGWPLDKLPDFRSIGLDVAVVDWPYWRQKQWMTAKEFCILFHVHDPRDFEEDFDKAPTGVGKTLGELVDRFQKVADRNRKGVEGDQWNLDKWIVWAEAKNWIIPHYMRGDVTPGERGGRNRSQPVSARMIEAAFVMSPVATKGKPSKKWWGEKMRAAVQSKLVGSRAQGGRSRTPGLWHPDLVAAWLVDKGHMTEKDVAAKLRKYFESCPRCTELAEMFSPQT